MRVKAETIEAAIPLFQMMRNHSPYRFGGKWYIAKTAADDFTAFRTKTAAFRRTIEQVWLLDFSK